MNETKDIPAITTQPLSLSLYHIDEDLRGLMEYRQERISDRESPPDTEELTALDSEIARYMEALPRKVSGFCAIIRSWRATGETAAAEIKRLKGIVDHYESMETRLKDICASVMEKMPEPAKGSRRLNGTDGSYLMLKRNGGLQPLMINSMLPDEFRDVTVTMPLPMFRERFPEIQQDDFPLPEVKVGNVETANGRIRAKLAEPCPMCDGTTDDPNRRFADSCQMCGGSGKGAVPGAYLGERSSHVEIR